MSIVHTYHRGRSGIAYQPSDLLTLIADDALAHGDIDRALERAFRQGTPNADGERETGLLDIQQRLREELAEMDAESHPEQTAADHDEASSGLKPGEHRERVQRAQRALRQLESLDGLGDISPEIFDQVLTNEEREWIERWVSAKVTLIESGLVVMQGTRLRLSAAGVRAIGDRLLRTMPATRRALHPGAHEVRARGSVGEATGASVPWRWGDPFDVQLVPTLLNAVQRAHAGDRVQISADDFLVAEREQSGAWATVLLIDISRSMFMDGYWYAAKRAAVALEAALRRRFRRDVLLLAGFSGTAKLLTLEELPTLEWDQFSHGTNLEAGLALAREVLRPYRRYHRQIIIVTDGEPTAYLHGDRPVFEHPVTERTLNATLQEARRIARERIDVRTVAAGDSADMLSFLQAFNRVVRGSVIPMSRDERWSIFVAGKTRR